MRVVLDDLRRIGRLLCPPLDPVQSDFDAVPPVWRLPTVGLGPLRLDVLLLPGFVAGRDWMLRCTQAPDSDVEVLLELELELEQQGPLVRATCDWDLRTGLRLRGPLAALAGRAVDDLVVGVARHLLDAAADG